MGKPRSWEVSDEFWMRVEPLIPPRVERVSSRRYLRKPGAGRKAMEREGRLRPSCSCYARVVNGRPSRKSVSECQFCTQYFRIWLRDGFFLALWQAGLAEYDEMEGIACGGRAWTAVP